MILVHYKTHIFLKKNQGLIRRTRHAHTSHRNTNLNTPWYDITNALQAFTPIICNRWSATRQSLCSSQRGVILKLTRENPKM